MRERHNHQFTIANEVDDPVGKHIDVPTAHNRKAIPATELGPCLGIPFDVTDRLGHLDVELITKTSLPGLVVAKASRNSASASG